jgi:hypothetical protein
MIALFADDREEVMWTKGGGGMSREISKRMD